MDYTKILKNRKQNTSHGSPNTLVNLYPKIVSPSQIYLFIVSCKYTRKYVVTK